MRTEEWQEKAAFIDKLRELTDHLNRCRAAYEAHTPLVSDEVYDILFSDLLHNVSTSFLTQPVKP